MKRIFGSRMALCVLMTVFLTGCFNPFGFLRRSPAGGSQKSVQKRKYVKKTSKPIAVVVKYRGNRKIVKVLTEKTEERETTYNKETKEPSLTWWQRMCRWFGSLGTFGIVLLIAGMLLCPGVTIGFVVRLIRRLKNALRETVKAVKESDAVSHVDPVLHDALSSNLSRTSKVLVGRIKAQL